MDDQQHSASLTHSLADFAARLTWDELPPDVRESARDHFVDTLGVVIAGLQSDVPQAVARVFGLTANGPLPLPGTRLCASGRDFAMLCGAAGHGLELDDGYRLGTVHPGVSVVPALVALAGERRISGRDFLCAIAVGYEIICALSASAHPAMRNRGYHPTSAAGPMGAAGAAARVCGFSPDKTEAALGMAASACGGLFAFLAGGGDVKRLHGGYGARGGLESALFTEAGIDAPRGILEIPSGWGQAFADGRLSFDLPPNREFRILDCYYKPHACCRHIQPAFEAAVDLMAENRIEPHDIRSIEVDTYNISAHHAHVGWGDFASAQLSFPFIMALAIHKGRAALADFDEANRNAPWVRDIAAKLHVRAAADLESRYPEERPSRVAIVTSGGRFTAERAEALGSRELPMGAHEIRNKFLGLVAPVLGDRRATDLLDRVWDIQTSENAGDWLASTAQA